MTDRRSRRIASIDWMRGLVMVLMVVDHASMAFNAEHLSGDSAAQHVDVGAVTTFAFLTRWVSHVCAPTFVFLAGTALAISIERRVAKGQDASSIDRQIVYRGLFIAILDPTLISLVSWRWTIQVLYAIGLAMVCMAPLRRLSTGWLLGLGLAWWLVQDAALALVWDPTAGWPSIPVALLVGAYGSDSLVIKYPLIPWLSVMMVGWVFGRYLLRYREGKARWSPARVLLVAGVVGVVVSGLDRGLNGYGNAFLFRQADSWLEWLHVSKYPPSLLRIPVILDSDSGGKLDSDSGPSWTPRRGARRRARFSVVSVQIQSVTGVRCTWKSWVLLRSSAPPLIAPAPRPYALLRRPRRTRDRSCPSVVEMGPEGLVGEVPDRVEERPRALGHHEVDRVEVPLAPEAPREVRALLNAGMEAFALRTAKSAPRTPRRGWHTELMDHVPDRDLVAQSSQ